MYKHNIVVSSPHYCYRTKAMSVTYSGCVSVALVIQHAKCVCYITLLSVACLSLPLFYTITRTVRFSKKKGFCKNHYFYLPYNFCL